MTSEEKLKNVLLATRLGPVVPFHGISDGHCTCGKPDDWIHPFTKKIHRPGKHPPSNKKGWIEKMASTDLLQIAQDLDEVPDANFAIVIGIAAIALDLDVRPDKNGIKYLSERGDLPKTITADSGSGGKHLYFRIPAEIENLRGLGQHGIDLKRNGVIMAPGSLHFSGEYYRWAPGLSPEEADLAEMPEWIITILKKPDSRPLDDTGGAEPPKDTLPLPNTEITPGEWRDDSVVTREWLKRVRLSGGDRSTRDFYNATSLAFWCSHHWDQYLRIWFASSVRSGKHNGNKYEMKQLEVAFQSQKKNWISKPAVKRPRGTAAKQKRTRRVLDDSHPNRALAEYILSITPVQRARDLSDTTKAVLELHRSEPELKQAQIAVRLEISRQLVSAILKRHKGVNTSPN
jgi:hypothetical protein